MNYCVFLCACVRPAVLLHGGRPMGGLTRPSEWRAGMRYEWSCVSGAPPADRRTPRLRRGLGIRRRRPRPVTPRGGRPASSLTPGDGGRLFWFPSLPLWGGLVPGGATGHGAWGDGHACSIVLALKPPSFWMGGWGFVVPLLGYCHAATSPMLLDNVLQSVESDVNEEGGRGGGAQQEHTDSILSAHVEHT